MLTLVASIFVFGLLVLFHEFGHFIVAKIVGIKVPEFSLGFGPKLAGIKKGETSYNLRLLPLGGFVRMAGMEPDEDDVEKDRAFHGKTLGQRVSVIFAGPLMNFLLAVLLMALVYGFQGIPISTTSVLDQVTNGSPAAEAGLQPGDKIVGFDGRRTDSVQEITRFINSHPGQEVVLEVNRNGKIFPVRIVPRANESGQGMIGVVFSLKIKEVGPVAAIMKGVEYTVKVTMLIIAFLGQMIVQQIPVEVAGPVGIVKEIGRAAQFGFIQLLQLAAFLSINLGLFNLLPIPALDGGRLLFLGWEGVRGKPLDPTKENFIHLIGFALLMLLIVVITYSDIAKLL